MPTPTEIFEQAACEIDAGQIQQGAKLAYEAARQSLKTKARQHFIRQPQVQFISVRLGVVSVGTVAPVPRQWVDYNHTCPLC